MLKTWRKRAGIFMLVLLLLLNIICASQAYYLSHFYPASANTMQAETVLAKLHNIVLGKRSFKSKVVDSLHIYHDTVSLLTDDGLRLSCWYLNRNFDDTLIPNKGTMIMFHGHGSNKSGVIAEAEAFYDMGWHVLMVDLRAHGDSEGEVCTIGYDEAKDVKAAYNFVQKSGEKHICLWGVSLGAATIMKAINDGYVAPEKIILDMPFGSLKDAVKGRLRMLHLPGEPLSTLLTFWGGTEQGFWAFNHKPWDYAKRIQCPVLLQWGEQDIRVAKEETTHIFNNLSATQKKLVTYANCGHESLYKKESSKWLQSVKQFLQ